MPPRPVCPASNACWRVGEAGTGTKKEEEKDKAPGQGAEGQGQGSGGFALLGAAHAGLAAAALLAPTALANAFFPGKAMWQRHGWP